MTVPWKAWKTKYGFFHASHRPLKIPQNRRDFHIPTAQACTAWKSGKPTTGFPLSHPVHAMTTTVLSLNRKTKRKEVGRYAASSFFMPLSLRSSGTDFMLILQLENAVRDADGVIRQVSFFVGIILTYEYVRIGGPFCLTPSPPSNNNVPASSCRSWNSVIFAVAPSLPSMAVAESQTAVVISPTSPLTGLTSV